MVGALALALSGVALATLSSDQLASLRPRWLVPSSRRGNPETQPPAATPIPETPSNPGAGSDTDSEPTDRPARARDAPRG